MEMCSWNHIHLHILINIYNYEAHFICYSFTFTHDVSVNDSIPYSLKDGPYFSYDVQVAFFPWVSFYISLHFEI